MKTLKKYWPVAAYLIVLALVFSLVGTPPSKTHAASTNVSSVAVVNTPNVMITGTPGVNVANTPNVNIGNSPSVSLLGTPTVDLDPSMTVSDPITLTKRVRIFEAPKFFYRGFIACQFGGTTSCETNAIAVGPGEHLVLEFVSIEMFGPPSGKAYPAVIKITTGANPSYDAAFLPMTLAVDDGGKTVFALAQPTKVNVPESSTMTMTCSLTLATYGPCFTNLHGYTEPVQ